MYQTFLILISILFNFTTQAATPTKINPYLNSTVGDYAVYETTYEGKSFTSQRKVTITKLTNTEVTLEYEFGSQKLKLTTDLTKEYAPNNSVVKKIFSRGTEKIQTANKMFDTNWIEYYLKINGKLLDPVYKDWVITQFPQIIKRTAHQESGKEISTEILVKLVTAK